MLNVNTESINNLSSNIYDDEFVSLINQLSESIKVYFKTSKYNAKETNNYLLLFDKQWKELKESFKTISQNNSLENINEILNQLLKNAKSIDTNLNLFFEDAKILFKKMKLKRKENILNIRKSLRSASNKKNYSSTGNSKIDENNIIKSRSSKTNHNQNQNIVSNNIKKIIFYLNQLKEYNEIIGKFSVQEKYKYINLQKNILNLFYGYQNDNLNFEKNTNSNYKANIKFIQNEEKMNSFVMKNKYENEILNLNNKIKELEKIKNENNIYYIKGKKFDELKKKIELELINVNSNGNDNINYYNHNDFESMIFNIIDLNKNCNLEINTLKNDIKNKNETIKILNLNNNKLKHDLLDKDNILQEKENQILTLSQDNQRYKTKYEDSNKIIKNLNNIINNQKNENFDYKNKIFEYESSNLFNLNNIYKNNNSNDTIIDLRKELQSLYKENYTLRNELNELNINMLENLKSNDELKIKDINNHSDLNIMRNDFEIQKKNLSFNKKKYENEINSLIKKGENLSKQLTLKNKEIISLQRENIKIKSLLNNNTNMNNNINTETGIIDVMGKRKNSYNNPTNSDVMKLINENTKLKNIINNYEKEKKNMRNSLYKLGQQNNQLNSQIHSLEETNYNETILSLQQELEQLRKMTEENNNKSLEYEQQINNLQKKLNEKDILINQYKEKMININNNSNNNANNNNINNNNNVNMNNKDINQLQLLNNTLTNEIENKNKEIENLKNNISNNNNNNNNYNQKLIELNNIINNDKYQIQLLNKQIMQLKMGYKENSQNDLINQYKKENNELNNAILKTNLILEEKDLIIKKLKENINVNNKNKDINNNNNNNIINNSQNKENGINTLNLKIASLEKENQYYKNKIIELQYQMKNTQIIDNKNNIKNDNGNNIFSNNQLNEELSLIKNENINLKNNINLLNQELSNLKNKKGKDLQDNNIKENNNTNINDKDDDILKKLKKKEEELEAVNTFIFKLQKEFEKAKEDNESYKLKVNTLQKENMSMKKQLERLSENMPKELNALKTQLDEANKKITTDNNLINYTALSNTDRNKKNIKNKMFDSSDVINEKYNTILSQLNEANKEIKELKNKNKELQFQLEEKEVKSAFSGFRTEDVNISNYEEEFDLRKMANGARDKNRSEDINIDYPGIQGVKDKLNELEFRFNSLVEQVKILIGNISVSQKIKPQVVQICQLIGYSPKTTGRILTSAKDRKKLLGI